jgi:hypothetical protein
LISEGVTLIIHPSIAESIAVLSLGSLTILGGVDLKSSVAMVSYFEFYVKKTLVSM